MIHPYESRYSGEKSGTKLTNYVEKPGAWYFPPLAPLITSGGRLLLAMLEKCVQNLKGSYLFCDTDSMCIVASKTRRLAPCAGGRFELNGKDAVQTLTLDQVRSIARKFNKLNPYDPDLVREILKIEDINHVDSDPHKPYRQSYGYAVSAKRYALFTESKKGISIGKASGHGLGYLFAPKERRDSDEDDADDEEETPEWVLEAWEYLLRKEFKYQPKEPDWLGLPAMMRMVMTSPNVMRNRRPEWLAPFNFLLFSIISDIGSRVRTPACSTPKFRSMVCRESWLWLSLPIYKEMGQDWRAEMDACDRSHSEGDLFHPFR